MGNRTSHKTGKGNHSEEEMIDANSCANNRIQEPERMLSLEEISELCLKLEESMQRVSIAINNEIFDEQSNKQQNQPDKINKLLNITDRIDASKQSSKSNQGQNPIPNKSNVNKSNPDKIKQFNNKTNHPQKPKVYFGEDGSLSETEDIGDKDPRGSSITTDEDMERDQLENRFHGMTRCVQHLIQDLTLQLDQQSRIIKSSDENVRLMTLVVSVVTSVNGYMAMLIRNIRKLRRILYETGGFRVNYKRDSDPILDVISDSRDVDAMLVELRSTEREREQLEDDAISVLVIYKQYRRIQDDMQDSIEANVRIAVSSMVRVLGKNNKPFPLNLGKSC